jgi:hypothetical protein
MKNAGWVLMLMVAAAATEASADESATKAPVPAEREFTVGLVQREIKNGQTTAEVIEALGSPNILTRDADGRQAWVYDKIATEAVWSSSSGGIGGGALGSASGASAGILTLLGGHYSKDKGNSRTSQRTLTVVVKFGPDERVVSWTFHASRF